MKQILKVLVIPFVISFGLLILCLGCLLTLSIFRSMFMFAPEINFGIIDFQDVNTNVVEIDNAKYFIKQTANSGKAGGYLYTISNEDRAQIKIIHGCGGLYWADDNLTYFVTVQPDYSKGTTTCSEFLSGSFIEVVEVID